MGEEGGSPRIVACSRVTSASGALGVFTDYCAIVLIAYDTKRLSRAQIA